MGFGDEYIIFAVVSYGIQILGTLALLAAAGAAIYYAYQAKKQAKETHELVLLGKREYEPNAIVRVVTKNVKTVEKGEGGDYERIVNVPLYFKKGLIDIPVRLINYSKGISEFKVTIFPWLVDNGGAKTGLKDEVIGELYRGEKTWILVFNEVIKGHFHIDLNKYLLEYISERYADNEVPEKHGPPSESDLITLLKHKYKLHLEVLITYPVSALYSKREFYDHYYLGENFDHKILYEDTKDASKATGILFIGEWVFGGRSENHLHP